MSEDTHDLTTAVMKMHRYVMRSSHHHSDTMIMDVLAEPEAIDTALKLVPAQIAAAGTAAKQAALERVISSILLPPTPPPPHNCQLVVTTDQQKQPSIPSGTRRRGGDPFGRYS